MSMTNGTALEGWPAMPGGPGGGTPACLSEGTIARVAAGDTVEPGILAHLQGCAACAAAVAQARADDDFLTKARSLAAPSLAPEGTPRIPGYGGLRVLSAGAQGTVYRAVQESTSRPVAIKVLSTGSISSRQRLRAEREAEIAARLRHSNIVTVFESRTLADGRIAVVMEFIDGLPIDRWQPAGVSPESRRRTMLRVFIGVCNAIHHAHLNGVIHRDVKPDNILVTMEGRDDPAGERREGPEPRPVVLDFGVAKAGGIQATITGEFAGTPAYASPEQVAGKPEGVDALTDVYSLGVILYKLLCGEMPYEVNGSIFDIARTISDTPPRPPRQVVPDVSADLEAIVLRSLRKEKMLRYQSAAALARDLERYLAGDPVDARSGSGWYLLRKAVSVNRTRLAWAGAAGVLLLAAGGAVVMSLASAATSARKAQQQHEEALAENTRARAVTELLREVLPNAEQIPREVSGIAGAGFARLYMRLETGGFKDDPELDQTLRQMWGSVYTSFGTGKAAGLVAYAEVSLRNGLVRLRRQYGPEHPQIATAMHELAGVLLVRSRFGEAESLCRETLAMRQRLLAPGSTGIADSRALLARVLMAVGRADEAAAEAQRAVEGYASAPQREADLPVAAMLAVRARVLMDAGDGAGCEPLLREATCRRLRRLPPDDQEVLASLEQCAMLVERWPACPLAVVCINAWGHAGGEVPALMRSDMKTLHAIEAESPPNAGRTQALEHVLRLQEALLGPRDPALVTTLMAQVRSGEVENNPRAKAAAALRASSLLAERFGEHDFSVLVCIEEAAVVLGFTGQPDTAVELEERALAIWRAVPPHAQDPLLIANAERYLGLFLGIAGRYEEAAAAHRKAIAGLTAAVGARHHTVALAESTLGFCLAQQGKLEDADGLTRESLALAESLPATPMDTLALMRFTRAHVLIKLGHHAEARPLLEESWQKYMRFTSGGFPWWREYFDDLVAVCKAAGDKEGEASWMERRERYRSAEATMR